MKKIWKKIVSVSFLFIFILSLGAGAVQAAGDKETVEYDESELTTLLDEIFTIMTNADSTNYFLEMEDSELDTTLNGYSFDAKMLKDTINGFIDLIGECGGYKGKGDYRFEADNDKITMTVKLNFKERDVDMTVVYDDKEKATSVTYSPEYTFSEKMQKAAINTLIGMGTVFAVLIVICMLIYCFKFLNKRSDNESGLTQSESSVPAVAQNPQSALNLVSNTELVAVIAAAVAASMGTTSTDGFVVRSIKKRRR